VILVTGSPRSGTTPVGDVMALGAGVRSLYEPLNFHVGDKRVGRYFEIPGSEEFPFDVADELVRDVAAVRLRLKRGARPDDHGWRRVAKTFVGNRTTVSVRRARIDRRATTILWKDPFAAFWVRRLVEAHNVPVVVTVRPPLAVAASFKRLAWGFDVAGISERLGRDPGTINGISAERLRDPVVNAAALWLLVYGELVPLLGHPLVQVVDVDHLVSEPQRTYRELFARLGVEWTTAVDDELSRQYGATEAPSQPQVARAHVRDRDVRAVNRYWDRVLDQRDVDTVAELTSDVEQRLRAGLASTAA
jgi:hypothetical protein